MDIKAILTKVFSPEYIFDFTVMVPDKTDRMYMVVGLMMVLLGSAFKLISNFSKNPVTANLWHRLATPLIVGGVLGVLWLAAREQNIKLFGSHFLAWVIGIVVLIWIYFPVMHYFKGYKEQKSKWEKEQIRLKYMN